jgi:hypothetical protein
VLSKELVPSRGVIVPQYAVHGSNQFSVDPTPSPCIQFVEFGAGVFKLMFFNLQFSSAKAFSLT